MYFSDFLVLFWDLKKAAIQWKSGYVLVGWMGGSLLFFLTPDLVRSHRGAHEDIHVSPLQPFWAEKKEKTVIPTAYVEVKLCFSKWNVEPLKTQRIQANRTNHRNRLYFIFPQTFCGTRKRASNIEEKMAVNYVFAWVIFHNYVSAILLISLQGVQSAL